MLKGLRSRMLPRAARLGAEVTLALLLGIGLAIGWWMLGGSVSPALAEHSEAHIGIRTVGGEFASTADGALTANFRTNTQTIRAGWIEVADAEDHEPGWVEGYIVAVTNIVTSTQADEDFRDNLLVIIDVRAPDTDCNEEPGTAGGQTTIATGSFTGTLIAEPRNPSGDPERLCFYLRLDNAPSTVAGAEVTYTLTFTADPEPEP